MPNPHGSFIWYELMTPDPDASKAFYDAVVGWDIEPRPAGEMDYRMIRRDGTGNAGGVMRLTDAMRQGGAHPTWLGYIAVDDVDTAVAAIQIDGGRLTMPAMDMAGVGRIAMVTDPQGAFFYVITPAPPPGQEGQSSGVFSVDQPQHIRWNELAVTDPQAAVDFYKRRFGWDQQGDMDMGPMGKYRFLQHGGVGIGAVMPSRPEAPTGQWSFYIGVDDIDRASKAVTAAGGTIVDGPHEIPGGEYSLKGIDPQQAAFGLVGPRKN